MPADIKLYRSMYHYKLTACILAFYVDILSPFPLVELFHLHQYYEVHAKHIAGVHGEEGGGVNRDMMK